MGDAVLMAAPGFASSGISLEPATERPEKQPSAALVAGIRRLWSRLTPLDVLLPVALMLWLLGIVRAKPDTLDQYGLLGIVPLPYFAGFAVLIVSIGILLARRELSGPRLALHLVALIFMIHATAPLLYPEPRYSWTYKHIGVVGYINAHGRLDASVDIYNNWPGFFALAAWFGQVAGKNDPLAYAAWAQLFFNLIASLELAFALRALSLTSRERWLALFLFVAGNWVGQDYFAPQALGFVLGLGVIALVLHWCGDDDVPRWLARAGRIVRAGRWGRTATDPEEITAGVETAGDAASPRGEDQATELQVSRAGAIAAVLGVYFVLAFTHELSPYVVAIQVTALAVVGRVRPWWIVLGLWGLCLAYLVPRFGFVNNTYHIATALTNPFFNLRHAAKQFPPGLPGRRLAASAARALSLSMWLLAAFGIFRRWRDGRSFLPMMALAFSPLFVLLAQSYGGEGIYRAYLFSLPWTACLVASLIRPERFRKMDPSWVIPPVALLAAVGLFLPAFFGLDMQFVMPPDEVQASRYFYSHAEPGSVLLGSPNFPTRLASDYDRFVLNPFNATDPSFLDPRLWGRVLGVNDLPILADKIRAYETDGATAGYVVLSTSQADAAELFGILPQGSLASLEQALLHSPDWTVFYRDQDTIIFQFVGSPARSN